MATVVGLPPLLGDTTQVLRNDGTWGSSASIPAGVIHQYAGAAAPAGYLMCDGSSVSRTTYSALFAAIGTQYGSVDSTHFTLPDIQGRAIIGVSPGGKTIVNGLGKTEGLTQTLRSPSHHHNPIANSNFMHNGGGFGSGSSGFTAQADPTSGDSDNLDTPAFITLNNIIKT